MGLTHEDKGAVLRLRPFLEYDSIVTLFTEESGKKTVLAKGLRRPISRLSGIIQPFSTISFECSVPRTESSFAKLKSAELSLQPPRMDPILFFLSEIAERFSREENPVPQFSDLLQQIASAQKPEMLPVIFLLKTLTIFGYLPEYGFCTQTNDSLEGGGKWLPSGEMVSVQSKKAGLSLDFAEIKTLRFWQKNSLITAEKVIITEEEKQKYLGFLIEYVEKEQGIKLRAKEYVI
jgi:DNA repair protein RecO (recombination protein O)